MQSNLDDISRQVRQYIVEATTQAGSGHLTSSLSAVELMVGLMFGGVFRYKVDDPGYANNDRLIFSKGHAAPLLYSLWTVAGGIAKEEMLTLRQFGSRLEGHPTRNFPYAEVTSGSLGQGLSVGIGMALAARMDKLSYRTYVLLGDSEMAEGQVWEAMQLAAYYRIDNLVGIIDVNRLGQRGETMYGYDLVNYERKCRAFGWNTIVIDGHDRGEITGAYQQANLYKNKPTMIIAKTVKGKGIAWLEDKEGWHGRALSKEESKKALLELGEMADILGEIERPEEEVLRQSGFSQKSRSAQDDKLDLKSLSSLSNKVGELDEIDKPADYEKPLSTREAYGHSLVEIAPKYPKMVVLDGEVSNSTFAETFKKAYPQRFFEMFIAEQNMVSVAVGLALRGKTPFVSTFAAFFTRAVDQIRLAQYSRSEINLVGSHAGVSIGQDGASQMGLEDIAIFRGILDSVVLYPADHVAEEKLAIAMAEHKGIAYMRTTRMEVEPLYPPTEEFVIGGSKTLRESGKDQVTIVAAGVTLYEALKAYEELQKRGVWVRVIDLYSIKPLDVTTLVRAAKETRALIVVEDHFAAGGMAEAVRSSLIYETTPIHSLAVGKMPKSGTPQELLAYEEIDAKAILNKIQEILV